MANYFAPASSFFPPEDICPDCGFESSCDCICGGTITADELEGAELELTIERLEDEAWRLAA